MKSLVCTVVYVVFYCTETYFNVSSILIRTNATEAWLTHGLFYLSARNESLGCKEVLQSKAVRGSMRFF